MGGLKGHPLPADVAATPCQRSSTAGPSVAWPPPPSQQSSTARPSVSDTDGMTGPSPGLQGHPLPAGVAAAPSLGSSTTRPSVGGTDGMDSPTPPRPAGPGRPLPRTAGTSPPRRRGSRPTSLRSSTARPNVSGTDGMTGPFPGLKGHPLPADVAVSPSQQSSTARP